MPRAPGHIRIRQPLGGTASAGHAKLLAALARNPGGHRAIDPGLPIDPDIVMSLDTVAGEDGWTHAMQLLPDGTADFVSHRPDQLGHSLRWMTQTPELSALGLMLPATAEANGHLAEKAAGHLRELPAGAEFHCCVAFGALDAPAALEMRRHIEAIAQL